ncbi:glutathione S-transferase family protein [Pseudomonas arsenicoxydans]|uniref:Glutathione S-transferase family protein n=1 Tax=Pseudomonas arsenicoxydans TaxID=702115 RepID=A0A502HR91_9PSED|nr:glutathione S-transferase family protein [Pseudomonas arsenicoxydans]TPG76174.1 glutathione S-transferase family protein [Pseudomonas arsenicoxydans]
MIVLYHCMSARSFRPLWMLEELQVEYELRMLPFPPRVHAREFLAINPLGTVPAMFDDQLLMTESSAMCEYLAVRHGDGRLKVSAEEPDFGLYLNWLHFGESTLTFPQTLILRYDRFETPPRRIPQVAQDYTRWFLGRLRAIDIALARRTYLYQERFTAADISVGYALMLGEFIGLGEQFPERVQQYWHRLQQRAGYEKALAAQYRAAKDQGVPETHSPLVGAD